MSDNVINFPNELDVEFTPEEEMRHEETVLAIQSSLMFLCDGIERGSEATWDHIMDASINLAIMAALKCGHELEDVELLFNMLEIERVDFDA